MRRYFFLEAPRDETRGVGGLFFDDLRRFRRETSLCMRGFGDGFLDAYLPIVERRPLYGERERQFQLLPARPLRRVQPGVRPRHPVRPADGGRAESILMSLPPLVRWEYWLRSRNQRDEARLADYLRPPQGWLSEAGGELPSK